MSSKWEEIELIKDNDESLRVIVLLPSNIQHSEAITIEKKKRKKERKMFGFNTDTIGHPTYRKRPSHG
jgi:hypothetical protein